MRRSFTYSRRAFLQNMVFVAAIIPATLALLVLIGAEAVYLAIIMALEAVVLVVMGISPLLTSHEVGDGALVLRQGWYFRAEVPVSDIRSVARIERGPARTGVFFRLLDATLYVTSRRTDLIEARLKSKRPFGWALGKRADRVVFDAEDTSAMVQAIEDDGSFAPVDA